MCGSIFYWFKASCLKYVHQQRELLWISKFPLVWLEKLLSFQPVFVFFYQSVEGGVFPDISSSSSNAAAMKNISSFLGFRHFLHTVSHPSSVNEPHLQSASTWVIIHCYYYTVHCSSHTHKENPCGLQLGPSRQSLILSSHLEKRKKKRLMIFLTTRSKVKCTPDFFPSLPSQSNMNKKFEESSASNLLVLQGPIHWPQCSNKCQKSHHDSGPEIRWWGLNLRIVRILQERCKGCPCWRIHHDFHGIKDY